MNNDRIKKASLINLILGYICAFSFLLLIILNIQPEVTEQIQAEKIEPAEDSELFNGSHDKEIVYLNGSDTIHLPNTDNILIDRSTGLVLENDSNVIVRRDEFVEDITVVSNRDNIITTDRLLDRDIIVDEGIHKDTVVGIHGDSFVGGIRTGNRIDDAHYKDHLRSGVDKGIDHGLLDRRISELDLDGDVDLDAYDRALREDRDKIGINKRDEGLEFEKLTLARDGDDLELGDIDMDFKDDGKNYGVGKGGELYAYNFPSRGIGAGVGSSAIGAGAGGGAGLGAGIGEAVLNGESVPALGGIGTGAPILTGQPAGMLPTEGVGGLVGGAGAGGAAGLTQGYVTEKLGIGIGQGLGSGNGVGYGANRGHNYEHLPKDGALHIMMHVDGSGSILNTRKQLEIMKDTILKDALLPYYKNDENLYNNRVTIVSNSGERTLKFFAEATKKDNVLAIAFQDEAQPAYHLPNFNKKPENHYVDDIGKLKSSLNVYNGVYRGVMFQVDRGKTFAKSFKEFVGNAFQGKGYLESNNLKKYHRDNNNNYIKNKDGIVFSDEYHAKDSGDPKYYLDLIFEASRKVGLDLDIYGAGLSDGKHNER